MDPNGNISDSAFADCAKLDTVYFVCGDADYGKTWEAFCENRINQDSVEYESHGYGNKYLCEAPHVYLYSAEEPDPAETPDGALYWYLGEDGRPHIWGEKA